LQLQLTTVPTLPLDPAVSKRPFFIGRIWQKSRPIVLMVVVALVIRLAVVPFVYDEWMSPYNVAHYEQGNVARSLLAGHGFGSPFLSDQPSAILPPVYPLVVAGLFAIFGIHTQAAMIAILSLNCLFSSLACVMVFFIARRSFGSRVALWSGWAWAFSPYGIYFSAEWAWSTHLLLLCLCCLFYLTQRMGCSPKLGLWSGFGVLAGFAALTEPSVLVVIPMLIAVAGKQLACAGRPWFRPALVASLAMAAAISPWIIRNAVVFHTFIPMRDSMGLEMYLGNNGYSFHWRSGDHHPNHDPQELAEYNRGELAYMYHKGEQANAYILAHPSWYVWMSARRALYLWTGYWSFDHAYLAEEPLDPANIPVAASLSLLGFIGLSVTWRRRRFEAIRYASLLFLYPIMYYFVHPEAYRMRPLDPFLAILGCRAVQAMRIAQQAPAVENERELALADMTA